MIGRPATLEPERSGPSPVLDCRRWTACCVARALVAAWRAISAAVCPDCLPDGVGCTWTNGPNAPLLPLYAMRCARGVWKDTLADIGPEAFNVPALRDCASRGTFCGEGESSGFTRAWRSADMLPRSSRASQGMRQRRRERKSKDGRE